MLHLRYWLKTIEEIPTFSSGLLNLEILEGFLLIGNSPSRNPVSFSTQRVTPKVLAKDYRRNTHLFNNITYVLLDFLIWRYWRIFVDSQSPEIEKGSLVCQQRQA
ncbi:hypothetical protein RclHR1_02370016 [Rhizophagus clarus]|uniref:Uncharacterized protein n=1 Tax=Rhizophagus clarus TaxID=94130 RepID=A0A2Z6RQP9_9GLOM|nr:hypothetical protein RclHR1_02370016 [Rhizophagus clarus]